MVDRAQDPRFSRGQPSATPNYEELNRRDIAMDVYRAFRGAGFSDAQAQALTAEINRENSLRPDLLFGSHTDPYNEARNVGMLSWQGSRAPEALDYLRERGLADEAGNITPSFEALQAQAEFIRQEMENNPLYEETREVFLANPDIDPETAHRVLGDDYIRWRRTDPEFRGSGYERIGEGYALLTGQDLDAGTAQQVRPQARPTEERADASSGFDALKYLDLAQLQALTEPPRMRAPNLEIRQGRPGAGGRALQRFGLESLQRMV